MRKLLTLACILTVTGATAQPVLPPPPGLEPAVPVWAQIETVDARSAPGPAMWHITKGNSDVWIVGTVNSMPKNLNWNKRAITELMDGATQVITPPGATAGFFEASWLLISYGGRLSLPRGQKLENTMPEEMRARFVATRTLLGKDAGRYETDTPVRAALRLMGDFWDKSQLNGQDAGGLINKLARDHDVPRKPAAMFEAAPLIKEVLTLPIAQQNVCLNATLEDIDRLSRHGEAAAQAWAVGDIKGVKAHFAEQRLLECFAAATKSVAALNQSGVTAMITAIDAALEKPGKTIVLIGMGPLLRRNGVLEQLEAQHLTIEGPAE